MPEYGDSPSTFWYDLSHATMDDGERDHAERTVRDTVERSGFEVFKLVVGPGRQVKLVLDRDPGPLTLDDCVSMNHGVRRALSEAHLDADAYSVDVESPGVNRALLTLRHFERFQGQRIKLVLLEPQSGRTLVEGVISAVKNGKILIDSEDPETLEVELAEIKSACLDPEMPF